jgi:peptide/nickel transport system substrate-binding protein
LAVFLKIKALARTTAVILIVILVVIAGVGVGLYYATLPSAPTTPTAVTTAGLRDTLTIDDLFWPAGDLNQFTSLGGIPYSNWAMYTVYQSLVTLNGSLLYQTGTIQLMPMLATDWSGSPDGMTYTFNLRQSVTFSNGDPFNAYQVWGDLYGLYYLSGNSSSFLNGYDVFDFSKANFGPATIALMTQSGLINPTSDLMSIMSDTSWPIYVTGPYQIVFHLKNPFGWLPHILVGFVGLIFDTQYVLQNGGFGTPTEINANFNQHPMPGTGPYVVASVTEGSNVKFTQNPTYWGRNLTPAEIQANPYLDPGHVKNVIINAKEDDVVRYTDLSTGAVQIAGIQTQNLPLVIANPDKYSYVTFSSASEALVGIAMNVERYPTNITAFRQAIVHAVNLTDISQRVFYGKLAPMVGPEYTAEKEYYDLGNLPPYSYDLDLAKKYLAESGVDVATMPPLEFRVVNGCTFCIAAAQVVQSELGDIGITVTVMVTPRNMFVPPYAAQGGTYTADLAIAQQVAQLTWFGSGTWAPASPIPADAWIAFVGYNSPNGNAAIYANPVVQKCVDAWTSTTDTTVIKDLCTTAQKRVYDDAPYIWLGSPELAFGGGSVVFDKAVVKSLLIDPVFTAYSETAIFNTVTFVSG